MLWLRSRRAPGGFALLLILVLLTLVPLAFAQTPLPDTIPTVRGGGSVGAWEWLELSEPFTGGLTTLAFTRERVPADASGRSVDQAVLSAQCVDGDLWLWTLFLGADAFAAEVDEAELTARHAGRSVTLPAAPNADGSGLMVRGDARLALLELVLGGGDLTLEVRSQRHAFALDGAREALRQLPCLAGLAPVAAP